MIWLLPHPLPLSLLYLAKLKQWCCKPKNICKGEVRQFVAHRLIGRPTPNNWAEVSEKENRFYTRWRQSLKTNEHPSPRSKYIPIIVPPSRPAYITFSLVPTFNAFFLAVNCFLAVAGVLAIANILAIGSVLAIARVLATARPCYCSHPCYCYSPCYY